MQTMSGMKEGFLAVQDRRVGAFGVVVAVQRARAQRESNAALQGGVRVRIEVGIGEIGDFARAAVDFDDVCAFHVAWVGAAPTLAHASVGGSQAAESKRLQLNQNPKPIKLNGPPNASLSRRANLASANFVSVPLSR